MNAAEFDDDLVEGIRTAQRVRSAHNGVGCVTLHLGHDGDVVCELRDGDGAVLARESGGRSLVKAVRGAEAARRRSLVFRGATFAGAVRGASKSFNGDYEGGLFVTGGFLFEAQKLVPDITEEEVVAGLAAHPRVVRVAGGHNWVLLPNGYERYREGA